MNPIQVEANRDDFAHFRTAIHRLELYHIFRVVLFELIRCEGLLPNQPDLHGFECDGYLVEVDTPHDAIFEMEAVFGYVDLDGDPALRAHFHPDGLPDGHGFRADGLVDCEMDFLNGIGQVLVHRQDCPDDVFDLSGFAVVALIILIEVIELELELGAGLESTGGHQLL